MGFVHPTFMLYLQNHLDLIQPTYVEKKKVMLKCSYHPAFLHNLGGDRYVCLHSGREIEACALPLIFTWKTRNRITDE